MNHNTGSPQDSHRSSESYLGELRSRAMRCAAFRLLDLFLSLASLAVLAALTIEVCIRLGGGFGSANALAALGATCVIAVLAFDAWGWRRNGLGRRSEARRLDCEVPGAHNRFETAWSFHHRPSEARLGLSTDLIEATTEWCGEQLHKQQSERVTGGHGSRADCVLIITAGLMAFLIFPGAQHRRDNLAHAYAWLMREEQPPSPVSRADSGNLVVARGRPATLWVEGIDDDASVLADIGSGSIWKRYPAQRSDAGRWEIHLPSVLSPLSYTFTGEGWSGPLRKIHVVDPPRLDRLRWSITPPAYTFVPERRLEHEVWDLSVPEGSKIGVTVEADQPLNAASLLMGARDIPLRPDPNKPSSMKALIDVESGGPFAVELHNDLGLWAQSVTGQLSVIPDATPRVVLLGPEAVVKVQGDEVVEIRALGMDDYGIGQAYLAAERNHEPSSQRVEPLWTSDATPSNATRISISYPLAVKPFDLYPGDEITYWVGASDTDGIHGPKIGISRKQIIRYPSLAEVYDDLFAEESDQVLSFQDLLQEQSNLTEQAKETAQDLRDRMELEGDPPSPEEAWEERQEIQDLQEQQQQLQEEYEAIQQALEEMTSEAPPQVEQDTGYSPEIQDKLERIQGLMNELLTEEGKQLMQQINQVVEQMAEEIDPEQVEELAYSFEEYEQDLDRTLEQLERTLQQRQLQGLANVAEDLLDRQEALQEETQRLQDDLSELQAAQETQDASEEPQADASQTDEAGEDQLEADPQTGEESDPRSEQSDPTQQPESGPSEKEQMIADRLAERQEQLRQDAEALLEAMEQTAELFDEMNPAAAEQLREARERAMEDQLEPQMSSASKSLAEMNLEQAMEQQQKAQESLQQMAAELQESLSQAGGMSIEIDVMALEEFFQRAMFLSQWQEQLVVSPLSGRRSQQSLEEEGLCRTESFRLASEWDAMTRGNPFIDPDVAKELSRAAEAMGRALRQGEGQAWIGYGHAEKGLGHVNRAMWLLQKNLRSLAMQASGGGAEQLMEELKRLAQQQRSLNDQARDMQRQQQQNQPGGEKEGFQESLRRMAQQQAKIRQEIERLMQQYRHVQEMQGRMEQIAAEMNAIEEKLQGGQLDQDTRDQQDRVLMRMLDAQVSQEQDIVGRKRKAMSDEEALEQGEGDDIRLLDSEAEMVRVDESDAAPAIPPAYRAWVKSYLRELGRLEG